MRPGFGYNSDRAARNFTANSEQCLNLVSASLTVLYSTQFSVLFSIFSDPFVRSMALWLSQEYALAAFTLVEEASCENTVSHAAISDASLADIFNFYTFLRRNPLVMRQRLTNSGIQVASTEKFLSYARDLEKRVTPYERRLYFRTAAAQ